MRFPTKIRATKAQLAFLGASSMMFSLAELALPRFVPFFRLGLSNLALMLGLAVGLDFKSYFLLVLIKIFSQAAVGGTLFSYVFLLSVASGLSSGPLMYWLWNLNKKQEVFSFLGISVAGAFASNIAQTLAAWCFLGSQAFLLVVPVAGLGLVTSSLLGLIANAFVSKSRFLLLFRSFQPALPGKNEGLAIGTGRKTSPFWGVFLALLLIGVFFIGNIWFRAGVFACSVIARLFLKQKPRLLKSALVIVTVTALGLLSPEGEILFSIGSFPITSHALESGFSRGLALCCTVNLSALIVKSADFAKSEVLKLLLSYVGILSGKFSSLKLSQGVLQRADRALSESYSCLL